MNELEEKVRALEFGEITTDSKTGFMITRTFGGYIYIIGQSSCFVPFCNCGATATETTEPKKRGRKPIEK